MVDIVVVVVVVVVLDNNDRVVLLLLLVLLRNNRWDKRVPFPHVHNIEIVLNNIPIEEMTKFR
jgi:hypothetical protein